MAVKWKPKTKWRDKLEKEQEPQVVDVPENWRKKYGPGKMLIPRPLDVDAQMRRVRKGRVVTQSALREKLAADQKVEYCCPMTTGIFIRIAAEAAEEDLQSGKKRITPYWRVVKNDGSLNEKFPGGAKAQAAKLKEEGHKIVPGKGKKPPKLVDHEKKLMKL